MPVFSGFYKKCKKKVRKENSMKTMAFTKNIKRKAEKKFLKISHAPNLQNHHSPNMKIHWHPEFFLLH